MILFKDIKQNYPVYILDKNEMTVKTGKVKTTSFPRMDNSRGGAQMVVDIEIEADGKSATYAIPENLGVTYAGNLVLSTDKQALLPEVEAIENEDKQVLSTIEKRKMRVERAESVRADLNPEYRAKQETEKRFGQIEGSISEMKKIMEQQQKMMSDFIKEFKS